MKCIWLVRKLLNAKNFQLVLTKMNHNFIMFVFQITHYFFKIMVHKDIWKCTIMYCLWIYKSTLTSQSKSEIVYQNTSGNILNSTIKVQKQNPKRILTKIGSSLIFSVLKMILQNVIEYPIGNRRDLDQSSITWTQIRVAKEICENASQRSGVRPEVLPFSQVPKWCRCCSAELRLDWL
jgi:hypothetical protein